MCHRAVARIPVIAVCSLLVGIGGGVFCTPALAATDCEQDQVTLQQVTDDLQRELLALLALLDIMTGDATESYTAETESTPDQTDKVKLITASCQVRETRDENSRLISTAWMHDEFTVIEQVDFMYHIRLEDGRSGWIDEDCVQVFRDRAASVTAFPGIQRQELRDHIEAAGTILARIDSLQQRSETIWARYSPSPQQPDGAPPPADCLLALLATRARNEQHSQQARYFGARFLAGQERPDPAEPLGKDLQGRAELTFGQTRYGIDRAESGSEQVEKSVANLTLVGELPLGPDSSAEFHFANRQAVSRTNYQTITGGVGFRHAPPTGNRYVADLSFYQFSDYRNTQADLNDLQRITLATHAAIDPGADKSYRLGYRFTNQAYRVDDTNDYTSHRLDAAADFQLSRRASLQYRFQSNLEWSDTIFHRFRQLVPSVSYPRRGDAGHTTICGRYESFVHDSEWMVHRSFGRAELLLSSETRDGEARLDNWIGLNYKEFLENETATYIQVRWRHRHVRPGPAGGRTDLSLYSYFFTNAPDNNFTDLRCDLDGIRRHFFRSLSFYARAWHDPGSVDGPAPPRPYTVDVRGFLGLVYGGIRIGPTAGLHLALQKGDDAIERDGNLFRLGAAATGDLDIFADIRLTLNASYEYGFVVSDELTLVNSGTVDDPVLVAEKTGIATHHPTALQYYLEASKPLSRALEMFARVRYYRIATDQSAQTSVEPAFIFDNDRFTAFLGVRYRHN
ncbi:MAG: hypothetical protein ABIF77_04160 [bacterium]